MEEALSPPKHPSPRPIQINNNNNNNSLSTSNEESVKLNGSPQTIAKALARINNSRTSTPTNNALETTQIVEEQQDEAVFISREDRNNNKIRRSNPNNLKVDINSPNTTTAAPSTPRILHEGTTSPPRTPPFTRPLPPTPESSHQPPLRMGSSRNMPPLHFPPPSFHPTASSPKTPTPVLIAPTTPNPSALSSNPNSPRTPVGIRISGNTPLAGNSTATTRNSGPSVSPLVHSNSDHHVPRPNSGNTIRQPLAYSTGSLSSEQLLSNSGNSIIAPVAILARTNSSTDNSPPGGMKLSRGRDSSGELSSSSENEGSSFLSNITRTPRMSDASSYVRFVSGGGGGGGG